MEPSNKRAIFISLTVNIVISLIKLVAATITRSAAMLAEAIHAFADTSHEVFLLLGVRQAQAPADERFPYGQGKAVYFWGFVAVFVFMLGGILTINDGVQQILHPEPISWFMVAVVILGISMVLNGYALAESLKQFIRTEGGKSSFLDALRNTKDPSMRLLIIQNSLDILGEGLALFAILLSQITGILFFDGAASILVGLLLVGSALWQAGRIKNLLIGQSADDYVVQGIQDLVKRQSTVREIVEITTLHMGPEYILVNLRVRFAEKVVFQDIERACSYLEQQIQSYFPVARRVYVKATLPGEGLQQEALLTWTGTLPTGEKAE